jgi:hypothetical protein
VFSYNIFAERNIQRLAESSLKKKMSGQLSFPFS